MPVDRSILDLFDLTGKVACVTGGGRGLGRTAALTLSAAGADVVLIARTLPDCESVAADITAAGGRALPLRADVTVEEEVLAAIGAAAAEFGRIDVLVNNAGMTIRKQLVDMSAEEWRAVIDTNLNGAFLVAREAARHMMVRLSGKIINMASVAAFIGLDSRGAYCASKAGLLQLTKTLAIELAPYGVNVNALAPGMIRTALNEKFISDPERYQQLMSEIPLKRLGTPDDLKGALLYLASGASDYVTGHALVVDGGWIAS